MRITFTTEQKLSVAGPGGTSTRVFTLGETVEVPEDHARIFIASGVAELADDPTPAADPAPADETPAEQPATADEPTEPTPAAEPAPAKKTAKKKTPPPASSED